MVCFASNIYAAAVDWIERAGRLRRWSRDGERAPRKPLLLPYALGRYQAQGDEPIPFSQAENQLRELLREFGPTDHRAVIGVGCVSVSPCTRPGLSGARA